MRKKAVVAFILIMGICATIFAPINPVSRADSTGKWRTFDKKTLYVHGYIVYRYNRNASSDVEVSIPLWANNFWSEVSLLKTEPESVSSYVKYNVATEKYDIPTEKSDQDAIYGATFFFTDVQPYQEIKAEVWMKLSISKVDMSSILSEQVGNVSDAKNQLGDDYDTYVGWAYYWDHNETSVKNVIQEIDANYSHGSKNVYDIVYATIDWFSNNMVYMEHEDYPASRLKASQILNETTTVADNVTKRYGVCRHFTDAFVAIMRGFGIPTNLFNGLVFYDMGGDVGVIFSGGHAWCEVYMPNIGWVPVEVTISDRYLRDIIRVGLISEYYYLPIYKEFAHPAPKPPEEPKEPYEYLVGAYWGWGVGEVPSAGTLDSIIHAIKSAPVMVWILLAVIVVLIVDSILIRRKIKALTSKVAPPPPPPPPPPTP